MRVTIKGKNIDVTAALKQHVHDKVKKVENRGLEIREIEVKLLIEKNPSIPENQITEMTIRGNYPVIRAREADSDMYVAVDKAVVKLERQIKKYHDKRIDRAHHAQSALRSAPQPEDSEASSDQPGMTPEIVRRKKMDLKPMTLEEASLQMELLGHDFFMFTNAETDQPNVIYQRRDGTLGLIEPSL